MLQDRKPLALVRSYEQLRAVLQARVDELEITREVTDAFGGMPSGYASKLLSRTAVKNIGPISLGALLGVLGLALVVVEDERKVLPKRKHRRVAA